MRTEGEAGRRRMAERLARFVEGTSDRATMLLDPVGTVTFWSPGAERLFGWHAEAILGNSAECLYTSEDRHAGRLRDDLAAVSRTSPVHLERMCVREDRTAFLAKVVLVALHDAAGRPDGYGHEVADISGRHATEQAQRLSERHIRSILSISPDAMIVIDDRGAVLSFSAAAEALFGYAEDELVGRDVRLLMPSPDRDRHDDYIARYIRTGERRVIGIGRVVTGERRDGTLFPMELSVGEVQADGRRIFIGFIRDLTSQQLTELRLKELQAELIHVSRVSAMGTMAATLAHELNQPLAAITLCLEGARELIDASEKTLMLDVREAMNQAAREALRAGQIVRRLREFVARGEVKRGAYNLPILVEESTRLGLLGTSEQRIVLRTDFDPGAAHVLVDRIQIQQVLVSLLRNAVQAVAHQDRRDILITTCRAGDMARVSVADSRRGAASDLVPGPFDGFVTEQERGLGPSLSICRTIVEAHGGRIGAGPAEGGGTVFHFTIPRADEGEGND